MIPDAVLALPEVVLETREAFAEVSITVPAERIREVCLHFREHGFNRLSSVTAVDWHPENPRFELVYHLHSVGNNQRVRIKCRVPGDAAEVDSVTSVWRSADWYEREVFDLFGINFRNHPDLRRIMMPDDWEGHPLRKDYPVHGHRYSYVDE